MIHWRPRLLFLWKSIVRSRYPSCRWRSSVSSLDHLPGHQRPGRGQRLGLTGPSWWLVASSVLIFSPFAGTTTTAFPTSSSQQRQQYTTTQLGMSFTTHRDGGTITVSPKNEADQSALIVICHGLGDSAEGFSDVAEHLASALPYVKVILPTAPTQPVTMNGGMPMPSWYDIVGLSERANENCKGIDTSKATVESILKKEHEATGLPYSRMVLAGFSQGGALSLFTGLQLPSVQQKLAGIVVMSGYLAASGQFRITPGLEDIPIFHGHGSSDPMVPIVMAQKTKKRVSELMGKNANYTLKSYPIPHSVCPEEIRDVLSFIKQVLPPDNTCKIKLKDPSEMSVKELKAAVRKAGLSHHATGFMEKREFVQLLEQHRAGKL